MSDVKEHRYLSEIELLEKLPSIPKDEIPATAFITDPLTYTNTLVVELDISKIYLYVKIGDFYDLKNVNLRRNYKIYISGAEKYSKIIKNSPGYWKEITNCNRLQQLISDITEK